MKYRLYRHPFTRLFLLLILLSSCKIMSVVNVEFPTPPKTVIPDDIQSLLLVNRVNKKLFVNNAEDSLEATFFRQNFNYDTIIFDQQSADTTLQAIGELLFESRRFDYVIPEDRFLNHDSIYLIPSQMNWQDIKSLCNRYNTDAILSLDYYLVNVSTSLNRINYINTNIDGNSRYFQATIMVVYSALFKIYYPRQEIILTSHLLKDTLIWENSDLLLRNVFLGFSSIKQALLETGIQIALKLSDQIAPAWNQEKRKYFSQGDKSLKTASRFVESDNWDDAMKEWEKIAGSRNANSTMRSKAEYNLALGYELKGDLPQAINWGVKSYESMYRQATYNYLLQLKKRKEKSEETKK